MKYFYKLIDVQKKKKVTALIIFNIIIFHIYIHLFANLTLEDIILDTLFLLLLILLSN